MEAFLNFNVPLTLISQTPKSVTDRPIAPCHILQKAKGCAGGFESRPDTLFHYF